MALSRFKFLVVFVHLEQKKLFNFMFLYKYSLKKIGINFIKNKYRRARMKNDFYKIKFYIPIRIEITLNSVLNVLYLKISEARISYVGIEIKKNNRR